VKDLNTRYICIVAATCASGPSGQRPGSVCKGRGDHGWPVLWAPVGFIRCSSRPSRGEK